jgi:PAS domain S-box-containing protein
MGTDTKEIAHFDADRNLINVLLVEDDAVDARLVERILAQSSKPVKFAVESVGSLSAAIDCLSSKKYDTVLLDMELPDSRGIETVQKVCEATDIPVVVLTGIGDEEMGISAIRNGASDYLVKNLPLNILLVRTIIYALERKKAIEALAQNESKFRTLVEHIPKKIFIKDKNSAYLFLNQNYAQDLKIKSEEIIGKTDYDFYPKELAEKYRADDKRIIETGKTEDIEEKYIENGKERWVHTIKTPYKDAKGNIIGVLGIFRDITEQKKTKEFILETNRQLQETSQKLFIAKQELENKNRALEKAQEELEKRVEERTAELAKANKTLQATKANLQEMIRQNADGIVIVDSNGTLRFVNPAACSLFNRKPEELIGEVFGFPVNIGRPTEIEVFRRNGKSITAEMHIAEIEWEGESANLVSIRDITERKQTEETLKKANEKLTEYNQLKDEFVSTASHELRTPLSIILGAIRLVLDEIPGKIVDEQRDVLTTAMENVNRLARIVDALLTISKIESGKLDLQKTVVNICELIKDTVSNCKPLAQKKSLSLDFEVPEEGIDIYLDPDRTKEILINLISNSIKFTPEGGWIKVTCNKLDEEFRFSVQDSGVGIAKDDMPRLFDKFTQFGRKAGPGEKGTGLGLAIVKKLVDMHNGRIEVESELNKGTTFTIILPLTTEAPAEDLPAETDEFVENTLKNN